MSSVEPPSRLRPNARLALQSGLIRWMAMPLLLWFVSAVALGLLGDVVRRPWTTRLFDLFQYQVWAVVGMLCCLVVTGDFFRRRHRGSLTKRDRGDRRFTATLLTALGITGVAGGHRLFIPLVVCAACRVAMQVRTRTVEG